VTSVAYAILSLPRRTLQTNQSIFMHIREQSSYVNLRSVVLGSISQERAAVLATGISCAVSSIFS